MVFVGSLYGGYFGAALGVMLVAALGLVLDAVAGRISALKNVRVRARSGSSRWWCSRSFGPVDWADVARRRAGHDGRRVRRAPGSPDGCPSAC